MKGHYFLLVCCVAASLTEFDDEKYITGVRIHGHKCPAARGQFAHESLCKMFYNCWDEVVLLQRCPNGLLFESDKRICDSPDRVNCHGRVNTKNDISSAEEYLQKGITKFKTIIGDEKYDPYNLSDFQIFYRLTRSNATMNGYGVQMHGLDNIGYNIVTDQHDRPDEITVDFKMLNLSFTAHSMSVAPELERPLDLNISSDIDSVTYRGKFHYSNYGTFLKVSPFNTSEIGYMWPKTAHWHLALWITIDIEKALKVMMEDVLRNQFRLLIRNILIRSLATEPSKCPVGGENVCGMDQQVYMNSCFLKKEGIEEAEWPWCLGNHYLCPAFEECPKPGRNSKMICSSDGYFYHNRCQMQYNNCGKEVTTYPESSCHEKQ